ncbi:MAG: helix-turn-helix transcriptional regulator [Acidobacteriota bacterium]
MDTNDDNVTEGLGERLSRLRRAKGWNQREMGRRMGLKGSQISKLERGSVTPRADILPRLSEVLGVSADYLLTGRSFGEMQRDYRIRDRVEALEMLPEPQRNHLVEFLDALVAAHEVLKKYEAAGEEGRRKAAKRGRPGGRAPKD